MHNNGVSRLLFAFVFAATSPILAGTITLTFQLDVYGQFDYSTQTNTPNFQPFSATAVVVFDDAVTSTEQDPNDTLIFFGLPLIDSSLTQTLPYGPTIPPTSREVVLGNRDYGPTQQFSEFAVVQDQETVSGTNTWAYDLDLDSGSPYPLIPNLLQDSSSALYQQLLVYQQDDTAFSFSEYAEQFDSLTGQPLDGFGYRATASLVDISQTPEPGTVFLMAAGLLVLSAWKSALRRCFSARCACVRTSR